jgi:membrane fusion protein (multidrug efflux system)
MDNKATTKQHEGKPGMRRSLLIVIILLAAGLYFGGRWLVYTRSHISTDDAAIDATLVQVSPKVGGRVGQVLVNTGAAVTKGQVLVRLERNDLEADVNRAAASALAAEKAVEQARAALGFEQADVSSRNAGAQAAVKGSDIRVSQALNAVSLERKQAKNKLRQARASLTAARADLTKAETDLERMDGLFANGAVSTQQRDAALNTADNAKAKVEAALAGVALAEADDTQITIRLEEVEALRATARQAQAGLKSTEAARLQISSREAELEEARAKATEAAEALQLAKIALQNADIRSPIDGVISQKMVEAGEMVSAGQPLLAVTATEAIGSVWITANLKETQIKRVRVGQPVSFSVDAYPGITFGGKVAKIIAGTQSEFALIPAQQVSGSFTKVVQRIPVKISITDRKSLKLVPGMSVIVAIDVSRS